MVKYTYTYLAFQLCQSGYQHLIAKVQIRENLSKKLKGEKKDVATQ